MTVELPNPNQWIPAGLDQFNEIGEGLLEVAVAALELYDRAGRYERQYVGHGTAAPVVRSTAKQLTVVMPQVYVGRAGEQQYQFVKGEAGKYGFQTAEFMVELSGPWPSPQGGMSSNATATTSLNSFRTELWRDGLVVYAAMIGLALGGIPRPWAAPGSSGRGHEMAVGPLQAKDPSGDQASFIIGVRAEL